MDENLLSARDRAVETPLHGALEIEHQTRIVQLIRRGRR
jgi:hypothetical protein